MPGARRLWTGPFGRALRDRVLADATLDSTSLWLVPTPLARDQVLEHLGARHRGACGLWVWCWDDLWRAVREASPDGPALLSVAGARAVLGEAIALARREGELTTLDDLVEWPGFRRRVRDRIAGWTRAERGNRPPAPVEGPAAADEWVIFRHYRALLKALNAEDDAGFAVWASKALRDRPACLKGLGRVTVLDLTTPARAVWRVLEHLHQRAKAVEVTLPFEPAEALREVYSVTAPLRQTLLDWGFTEEVEEPALWERSALRQVEGALFRDDNHKRSLLRSTPGDDSVRVIGAPRGEGVALVVAREVRRLLDRGVDPEEVLVLFPRWDADAAVVLATLRAWGLPAAAEPARKLASEPAVSALRLAMRLPIEGWETERLVQLLRNGRVHPPWPEAAPPDALASAATTLKATRVFRGRPLLLRRLDHTIANGEGRKLERARAARDLLVKVGDLIEPANQSRTWDRHVFDLRRLATALGLDDEGLDPLWLALEDHGAVLSGLGRGARPWSWTDFTREVETLVGELAVPGPPAPPGSVRLATVDAVAGARADQVLLVNLAEGTFPSREAVDPNVTPPTEGGAFAREMLRFLRVVGSAGAGLTLVYPTSDEKGQELLMAGFLEDLLRLFDDETRARVHINHRRFDPALADWPDLAGAPADARVRALARACSGDDLDELARLAADPRHRPALCGAAAALVVAQSRLQTDRFDAYDGRLADPGAIAAIAARFGPDYVFSPSQLETFITCPFQFYLRYVLKLDPADERDELDEDYTERGSRIHRLLEELENWLQQDQRSRLELSEIVIKTEAQVELTVLSDVDNGLNAIERRRVERFVRRYVKQHEAYEGLLKEARPEPHQFEVVFGQEDQPESHPCLVIGRVPTTVKLQGKIDRVDLVRSADEVRFRVIDYKTGQCPSKKDVQGAIYVQLPLYALAVERLVFPDQAIALQDVGYWGLKNEGYKPIPLKSWADDQEDFEAYVVALVNHLRGGAFVVESRQQECTHYCEFSAVCRVGQVRAKGKVRDNFPTLEWNR